MGVIGTWPEEERPREKLMKYGEHALTDSELLAILVRTGTRGQSAVDLSRAILTKFGCFRNMSHTDIRDWREFKGLGAAKIAQIKAALEVGRRLGEEKLKRIKPKITSSRDVIDILAPRMRDLKKEVVKIMLLNPQNRIIEILEIEEGTVIYARPIIREIFQRALQYFAAFIICTHNHPSGDSRPSPEDKKFTLNLIQAGEIMEVKVLDHIIIGDNRHFSFADKGLISKKVR